MKGWGTGVPLLGTCQKPIPMSWALFESIAKRHVATINGLLPRERVGPSIYPSPRALTSRGHAGWQRCVLYFLETSVDFVPRAWYA